MVLQGEILADAGVDKALHLAQFFGRDLLEVGEVETQSLGRDERALLFHVLTEDFAQGLIHQVGGGVVGFGRTTAIHIDAGHELGRNVGGQFAREVNGEVVFALRVEDFHRFLLIDEHTGVAHLTTHFGIEGRGVEHELEVGLLLLRDLAILEDAATVFGEIPSHELRFAFVHRTQSEASTAAALRARCFCCSISALKAASSTVKPASEQTQLREVKGGNRRCRRG